MKKFALLVCSIAFLLSIAGISFSAEQPAPPPKDMGTLNKDTPKAEKQAVQSSGKASPQAEKKVTSHKAKKAPKDSGAAPGYPSK